VAKSYLEKVRARLAGANIPVSVKLVKSGDARHLLARAIAEYGADIVVMASQGQSGHTDVPAGSVAMHLISQTQVPILLVRNHLARVKTGEIAARPFLIDGRHLARAAA
jgi:nucleotide-binding universal stress UspA family protein